MPIYVIQAGEDGPCKIGVTENVWVRLQIMQTNNHVPLRLVALFEGDISHERKVHHDLADYRIAGEWFTASPEIISDLVSLPKISILPPERKPPGWQKRQEWAIPSSLLNVIRKLGGIEKISRRMGVSPQRLEIMIWKGRIPPERYGSMCIKRPYAEYRRQRDMIARVHRFFKDDPNRIAAMPKKWSRKKDLNA